MRLCNHVKDDEKETIYSWNKILVYCWTANDCGSDSSLIEYVRENERRSLSKRSVNRPSWPSKRFFAICKYLTVVFESFFCWIIRTLSDSCEAFAEPNIDETDRPSSSSS